MVYGKKREEQKTALFKRALTLSQKEKRLLSHKEAGASSTRGLTRTASGKFKRKKRTLALRG